MKDLPDDLWHMICTQLRCQRDLNTLFNCACSGKRLAQIALSNLYRMYEISRTLLASGNGDYDRYWERQVGFWRTLFFSSLGKTLYPYCQHIRTIGFQDLGATLALHPQFRAEICAEIIKEREYEVIETVGETIMKQAPLLEELTGIGSRGLLSRWIPRLPRLTVLKKCGVAAAEGNGSLIRLHCPLFKELHLTLSTESNFDQVLANFLKELRPKSLRSFGVEYSNRVGPQSFQALSLHGESLAELKLDRLALDFVPNISLLKGCTNLVSLSLGTDGYRRDNHDLEENHKDAFLETIAWLKECKQLKILKFGCFPSASALMASVLTGKAVRLTSLHYEVVEFPNARDFFTMLADQKSLRFLLLKGLLRSDEPERADMLVESLSKLVELNFLYVDQTYGNLSDLHIMRLASCLPKLEEWVIFGVRMGNVLTDAIWDAVASLRLLQRLGITAKTRFTTRGIIRFIEKLGPGNKGLCLSVTHLGRGGLSNGKRELIQKRISEKVGGGFRY